MFLMLILSLSSLTRGCHSIFLRGCHSRSIVLYIDDKLLFCSWSRNCYKWIKKIVMNWLSYELWLVFCALFYFILFWVKETFVENIQQRIISFSFLLNKGSLVVVLLYGFVWMSSPLMGVDFILVHVRKLCSLS